MIGLYRRNVEFKKNLPKYRLALRRWMWRDKKAMTPDVHRRWMIVSNVETLIVEWEYHENFITRFFIKPPDTQIKEVLSWG